MPSVISYGIGYTAIDAAGTSVTIDMPPIYAAGNLLVMAVTGGGTADTETVTATAPSGWTALSGSGTAPSVFWRNATGTEPASYTVSLSATATASGFIAAYPAATLVSSAFHSSAVSVTSYSPAFPSGVTGSQTVLLVEAAVSSGTNVGWGGCDFDLPSAWTTEVPVFGQSMPDNTPGVMPCAIGLADITGSTSTPTLKSPLDCQIFAAYLVLDVTGTAPAAPYAVTAVSSGSTADLGLALTVKALSGAASAQVIYDTAGWSWVYGNGTSQPPEISITPAASGSWVYGAVTQNIGVTAGTSFTPLSGTTFSQNVPDALNSCIYGTFRSAGTTTAGTEVTLGGTAPDNAYFTAAAAEMLAAPGGSLAETASVTVSALVPGDFATTTLALPAYLASQPAPGTLLVALVSATSLWENGNATVTVTDSLGLTWYEEVQQPYPSYSGVWIASVPVPAAALTVTPAFSASGSATASGGGSRQASLTVAPGFAVATYGGSGTQRISGAALTVAPSFTGLPSREGLTPFPAWSAARNGLPGDTAAVNDASQAAQFLAAHGITAVYQGASAWPPAQASTPSPLSWISSGPGWLPACDVDQPFSISGTATGRIEVAVQAAGNGADLTVTLCPDNGSGSPNLTAPIAGTRVPAAQILNLTAPAGLPAGPLATARGNGALLGPYTPVPWSQPAVSLNGAGTYAAPVTSGNWTLFVGGYDNHASAAISQVTAAQYLGGGVLSAAVAMPSLPQATWYACAAATSDTLVAAGGTTTTTPVASTWSASWDPSTGTVGAWSAQQALPYPVVAGAAAAWGSSVYVLGGSPASTAATASANTWIGAASNGQITAWAPGPPLPQPLFQPLAAVVGNWLIVAGGISTSGTILSATWYAAINPDGTLSGWYAGPALPSPCYAFVPAWNLAVTSSTVLVIGAPGTGATFPPVAQSLTFTADGPAARWLTQCYSMEGTGAYQIAAFPSSAEGTWDIVAFNLATYDVATLYPVPVLSVPLPATGLASGATYHLVFSQSGGDATNNYLQLATQPMPSPLQWQSRPAGGGSWTPVSSAAIACTVFDQTAAGPVLHTWEDSGARVTSPVWAGASGQLLGLCEATAFLDGTVLPAVTQVTYGTTGLPSGLVQLT